MDWSLNFDQNFGIGKCDAGFGLNAIMRSVKGDSNNELVHKIEKGNC